MFSVEEIKGSVENPDIEDRVNEFLDKLNQLDNKIDIYNVEYSTTPTPLVDGEDVVYKQVSSALILYYIHPDE